MPPLDPPPRLGDPLPASWIPRLAALALAGITRPYPHKPGGILLGPEDVQPPRTHHPAFYGCFDWHSAVHAHWCLVRLLKVAPTWPARRAEVVRTLADHLTAAKLRAEADWLAQPAQRGFERTYGWAWLLRLAQELHTWDDDLGRAWRRHLRPLEEIVLDRTLAWLPQLPHPLRSGQHGNTAFALTFFLAYARATGHAALEARCVERARTYYLADTDYPVRYEPSGHDFFSGGLAEADLMRRVLPASDGARWLHAFLPGLRQRDLGPLALPASVDDVSDGKLVHLAGLDLTRAWMLRSLAAGVREDEGARSWLHDLAAAHMNAGLGYVVSGDYAGEHWLASFAVFLLSDAGMPGTP